MFKVDHLIPRVPVRQWVLSFPIPLRSLFAVHPELPAPVLQIIHRVITTHLIRQAGVKRSEAGTGAVTFIQRFDSAANLNIHLHGLVLDGVYRTAGEDAVFHPAPALTSEKLQALLGKLITRILRLLTRERHLVEAEGVTYVADAHGIVDPDNLLAPPCKPPPALTASRSGHGRRHGPSICFRRLDSKTRTGFGQRRWVGSACARARVRIEENRTLRSARFCRKQRGLRELSRG